MVCPRRGGITRAPDAAAGFLPGGRFGGVAPGFLLPGERSQRLFRFLWPNLPVGGGPAGYN